MIKKSVIILFICMLSFMGFQHIIGLSVQAERAEHKLTTAKHTSGVMHFGTGKYVMVPDDYQVLQSEMRGVWVATVYNIAISKQNGVSDQAIMEYKEEYLEILDRMEEYGMNTVYFQVRPNNDAFYQSNLNDWSKFLVGEGVDPGWDPLAWMVEETHKRGYRFMCWMNAFRVTTESYVTNGKALNGKIEDLVRMKHEALAKLANGNFAKKHPEYVIAGLYDEKLILNPSEPAVQKFIVDVIMEIVENYNVDGLHFDDYFYLEGANSSNTENTSFVGYNGYLKDGKDIMNDMPNYQTYLQNPSSYGIEAFGKDGIYGMPKGLNLGDFRRENINMMMRNIRKKIDAYNQKNNTCVEFGTKPAAVWRSNSEFCSANSDRCVSNGSNTHEGAYSTYNDLYADSLKWVQEGLVDWVAPQVYYHFEDEYAPYADVVDWWVEQVNLVNEKRRKENKKEIRLYIAHGIYKYRDAPNQFYRSNEITDQIKYNNKYQDTIQGSAVYSYEILYKTLGSNIVNTYPNAENIRRNAMSYFKSFWANHQVYPLPIGKNDASDLTVNTYKIRVNATGLATLQFEAINHASCYGLYKLPKGVTFDANSTAYRQGVYYAGYEENKIIDIQLGTLDSEYEYYLVPVSVRGYLTNQPTKLDLEKVEVNLPPNPTHVDLHLTKKNEHICGTILTGQFTVPTDDNYDQITYSFKLLEKNRRIPITVETKIENNIVYFSWKSFYYEASPLQIVLELSDGDLQTDCYSETFSLVDDYTPDEITFEELNPIYDGLSALVVNHSEVIDVEKVKVYLVKENRKTDITVDYLKSDSKTSFTTILPDENVNNCYIEFVLTNGDKTVRCRTSTFSIEKTTPNEITIYTNQENYDGNTDVIIQYTKIENTDSVKVYLVKDQSKVDITEVFEKSVYETSFQYRLPDEQIENGYIEFELSKGTNTLYFQSNKFSVHKVTPDPIVVTVDDVAYDGKTNLTISFTPITNTDRVKVYFVNEHQKLDITDFFEKNDGTRFTYPLPNTNLEHCYIEFALTKGINTSIFQSTPFTVRKVIPKDIPLSIDKLVYDGNSDMRVFFIKEDCSSRIKINLVINGEIIDISNDYYSNHYEDSFTTVLPNGDYERCYIEIIVLVGEDSVTYRSPNFKIIKIVEKKNCKTCNHTSIALFTIFAIIPLVAYFIKKRMK